jgi:ParB-like chromosome segregation protein Spo0J
MTELANDSSLRRADIARREGLTRARVTQLLTLNQIPPDAIQQARQNMADGNRPASVRALLRIAAEGGHGTPASRNRISGKTSA